MRGQIKVKNWVYMVVIPRTITSYCPVDINGHSTHQVVYSKHTYIIICIPTHSFDKKHDRSKHWDISQLNPTTSRISLLLTLVLGSASDSCNNKDILLVVGFNYNFKEFCVGGSKGKSVLYFS